MSIAAIPAQRFHFGLTVANLPAAVEFYEILLGTQAVKHFEDYAKFDVVDPPLVLALHTGQAATSGALNHVGFRVASSEALVAVQERLEARGIRTVREDGVECCYALQTKFWVADADRNLWEIYTLDGDIEHAGFGGTEPSLSGSPQPSAQLEIWTHVLTSPPPDRIPHQDNSLDEVLLEGTCNAGLPEEVRQKLLREAARALRPGGKIRVHGLVSDKPFPGTPQLPGPAAMVREIPLETLPAWELEQAGFIGLHHDKLGDIHCFNVGGVELRELCLSAFKPLRNDSQRPGLVMYRGPLAEVVDERGVAYRCGERVNVDAATWELFQQAPFAEEFVCFPRDV